MEVLWNLRSKMMIICGVIKKNNLDVVKRSAVRIISNLWNWEMR